MGARVLPRLKVEAHAVVRAGAVVTRSVGAQSTVVGVPAKARDRSLKIEVD